MDQRYIELRRTIDGRYKQNPNNRSRRNNSIDNLHCFNQYSESKFISRSEFSRDRDRILFSRAFRRLEHKAQIYPNERGDHYRTRLTHTLEVLQIARNISRYLGLNEDLTEAITLGHDIGHTPFGHEGERVLDEILSGEANFPELKIYYTGFKHNFNSLKVLDIIEKKYNKECGLNLTWQVLEGILKHTKIRRNSKLWCDLDRFLQNPDATDFNKNIKNFLDYEESVTLEGQVVAVADEIAQRQHDLDDGMRDNDLGLKYEDIFNEVNIYIKDILNKHNEDEFIILLKELEGRLEKRKNGTDIYKRNTLIRDIIEYFICDVTLMSFNNVEKCAQQYQKVEANGMFFTKKLISFSPVGREFDQRLNRYIKNRIVNSNGVNRFDGKANYVIKRLFKAYYANPRQMSISALERLSFQISKNSEIYNMKFKDGIEVKCISFFKNKPEEVNNLINYLKMEIDINELMQTNFDNMDFFEFDSKRKINVVKKPQLDWINKMPVKDVMLQDNETIKSIKCMLEDHYSFLSVICDHISGMTDNYANKEYHELYQT